MDSLTEPQWPPGLAVMKTIDDLLRCGICFEYFNIAMIIPQCSHNSALKHLKYADPKHPKLSETETVPLGSPLKRSNVGRTLYSSLPASPPKISRRAVSASVCCTMGPLDQ
ncbi:hypothetical protein H8959_020775 [Pygathrix nigripes]